MKLADIAKFYTGPIRTIRDGYFDSLGMVTYQTPRMLVFLESETFLEAVLGNQNVSAVITTEPLSDRLPESCGVVQAENPRRAFYELHNALAAKSDFYSSSFESEISPDVMVAPSAHIASQSIRIGRGTIIEPGVTILENSIIGEDVILRAGCVVGSQGFEFKRFEDEVLPVTHIGGVKLGDRVEIQANTVVCRAVFAGYTEVGDDTKVDNLVNISHNVRIGQRCLLAALAYIGGSTIIGDDVWIGPSAGISNGITIGDKARITMGSVVTQNVGEGEHVTGNFAIDHRRFIEFIKSIR